MAELEAGILDVFGDGSDGLSQYSAALVWPKNFLSREDPAMEKAQEAIESYVTRFVHKEIEEGLLIGWGTLALARLAAGNPGLGERIESMLDVMINDVPTEGTRHFGEFGLKTEGSGCSCRIRPHSPGSVSPWYLWLAALCVALYRLRRRISEASGK